MCSSLTLQTVEGVWSTLFNIGVPGEKRESTLKLLETHVNSRKISVEGLDSLIGKLQFNKKAVRKERSYLYALRKQLNNSGHRKPQRSRGIE